MAHNNNNNFPIRGLSTPWRGGGRGGRATMMRNPFLNQGAQPPPGSAGFNPNNHIPSPGRPTSTSGAVAPRPQSTTYKVLADPPTPPNWTQALQDASTVLAPFHKIQVSASSAENDVLSSMAGSNVQITSIERVINPELWRKFINARKELLVAKSDDLALLAGLGLSDAEIHSKAHINLNFQEGMAGGGIATAYSDNVALLWHGSRGGSLDPILSQGLDERLGNERGMLGRGIYFADDPVKAMSYDTNGALLVCLVYLGDCLYISGGGGGGGLVREPEKSPVQRRNPGDLFFDSIVGRMPNEYVIFNRNYCYPMYVVNYDRGGRPGSGGSGPGVFMNQQPPPGLTGWNFGISRWLWGANNNNPTQPQPQPTPTSSNTAAIQKYAAARRQIPSFVWGSAQGTTLPYPFFAQDLFHRMRADDEGQTGTGPGAGATNRISPSGNTHENDEEEIAIQLSTLVGLGFMDHEKNLAAIHRFGVNNLERIVDFLCDGATAAGAAGGVDDLDLQSLSLRGRGRGSRAAMRAWAAAAFRAPRPAATQNSTTGTPTPTSTTDEETMTNALTKLCDLGFMDIQYNKELLAGFEDNLEATINYLFNEREQEDREKYWELDLDTLPPPSVPVSSSRPSQNSQNSSSALRSSASASASAPPVPLDNHQALEECSICAMEYPTSATRQWKVLSCNHKLCTTCHRQLQTSASTMSGVLHTYIKCPFCQTCSGGLEIGTCPNGSMTSSILPSFHAAGYESSASGVIQINYNLPGVSRIGYLPNNPEGQAILALLRIAWDRRLIFSIGTSMTTGAQNAIVWNIHHKTALVGGVGCHGYPDPTYLDRVRAELKQYGI